MLADQADLRCGDSFFFDVVSKPAYGARAVWSNGDKHHASDVVLLEESRQGARGGLH
jgi:hypothetical protein